LGVTWHWHDIGMTLTYLSSAEVILLKKIALFRFVLSICEKRSIYRNNFNGQLLTTLVWAFQGHQHISSLPLNLGRKHEENGVKFDFSLPNDKTLQWSFNDQRLRLIPATNFEIDAFYSDLTLHRINWPQRTWFKIAASHVHSDAAVSRDSAIQWYCAVYRQRRIDIAANAN